jgi:hypothetical protein
VNLGTSNNGLNGVWMKVIGIRKDVVMRLENGVKITWWFAAIAAVVLLLLMPAGSGIIEAADVMSGPAPSGEEESTAATGSVDSQSQVIVYYFHGARRCNTCRTIEAQAEEAIKSNFAKELESGALLWKVINYDDPANEHFKEDFGLVSSSLVVVEMKKGAPVRFDVLQKAWSLVRDESGFDQYVHQSVRAYVG